MTTPDTSVDETAALGYDPESRGGLARGDPRSCRGGRAASCSLRSLPTLLVVLLLAGGFFAGVEVEKGQSSSTASTASQPGSPPCERGRQERRAARGTTRAAARISRRRRLPGAAGLGGGLTTGEVSYVSGSTLYVTSGEGTPSRSALPPGPK